jgi:predicted secreted Zn-dependent protease
MAATPNELARASNASRCGRLRVAGMVAVLAWGVALSACSQWGQRTELTVGYYALEGHNFEDLDRQIALHGPTVQGVGKALAATTIRMHPDFRYRSEAGKCVVSDARIRVQAHVTLPRLAKPEELKRELAGAWDNLAEYTRLHESIHVAIADDNAIRAEKKIRAMPPEADCPSMHAAATRLFNELMIEHEAEQQRFDAEERENIRALVARSRGIDLDS